MTGIYEMSECIAFVYFAFGAASKTGVAKMVTPNYVLFDSFSRDFSEHERSLLSYKESEIS